VVLQHVQRLAHVAGLNADVTDTTIRKRMIVWRDVCICDDMDVGIGGLYPGRCCGVVYTHEAKVTQQINGL
jgi:hypothetical protein